MLVSAPHHPGKLPGVEFAYEVLKQVQHDVRLFYLVIVRCIVIIQIEGIRWFGGIIGLLKVIRLIFVYHIAGLGCIVKTV
jgi:hypothetical protein